MRKCRLVTFVSLAILLALNPQQIRSQGQQVNCDSGSTIRAALASLKPGDTLIVTGTCTESVAIDAEVSRITLDGRGSATILSPNRTQNVIAIRGREITIRGFTLGAGNIGIAVQRGGTAVVDGNLIRNNATDGILVSPESSAVVINNIIEQNQTGIAVGESSSVRVGWQVPTTLGLPNTIQNNALHGILVFHNSSASIIGATIRNNGGDGIRVERASQANISGNSIDGNAGNGITVRGNSAVDLDLGRIQVVALPNSTVMSNGGLGLACSVGAYVSGSVGTLTGAQGAVQADSTCIQGVGPLVSSLSFDPVSVAKGATFTAIFSGTNLEAQTYFDLRYRAPASNTDQESLNWQQGLSAIHSVAASIESGTFVITAVRAHKDVADHTGPFSPVSASLSVR